MKNREDFINGLVHLEKQEPSGKYGHYPFQLVSVTNKNEIILAALDLGGDVHKCYRTFKQFSEDGKQTYMSVDFPAGLDIDHDFIAVFSNDDDGLNIEILPYDENGQFLERKTDGLMMTMLTRDFSVVVLNKPIARA